MKVSPALGSRSACFWAGCSPPVSVPPGQPSCSLKPSFLSPHSSLGHDGSVSWPHPKQLCPLAQCLPGAISVQGPADAVDPTVRCFPEADTQALLSLGFRVQVASNESLCLLLDFGDGCGVQVRIRDVSEGTAVTAFHQFGKGGWSGVRLEHRQRVQTW